MEVLISLPPSGKDIRGIFYLRSLGKVVRPVSASVTTRLRNVTFLNVVDVFIILRFSAPVKPLLVVDPSWEQLPLGWSSSS